MKHKRIIALIGSLSLMLGCFSNAANCEEAVSETAALIQNAEVTSETQASYSQEEAAAQDETESADAAAQVAEPAPEPEPAPETPPPEVEPVAEPEPEPAPEPEPEPVPAPEPVPEPELPAPVETETGTEPAPNLPTEPEDAENATAETGTESMEETEAEPVSETDAQGAIAARPDSAGTEMKTTGIVPETEGNEDITVAVGTDQGYDEDTYTDTQEYDQGGAFEGGDTFSGSADLSAAWQMYEDFRFIRVAKQYAIVSPLSDGLIREEMDAASEAVGKIRREGLVYILEKEKGWCFVESGMVRGFMKEDALYTGDAVDEQVKSSTESSFPKAIQLCAVGDNKAFTFTHTTVHEVVAEKREGLLTCSMDILEYASPSSKVIGQAKSGTLVYLLTAAADGWYFVESGNVRGFVPFDCILAGDAAASIIEDEGEARAMFAKEVTVPEENKSLYFTIQSVREAQESLPVFNTEAVRGSRSDPTTYSAEQLQLIWAIVAQEDNGSYEGALAVISSAMNRAESPNWGYLGGDALSQLTAPGQYCYSLDNYWQSWLGGNVPEYVKQAVNDCLVYGIRNHSYTSFRSTLGKTTGADAVQIGGNWFFGS